MHADAFHAGIDFEMDAGFFALSFGSLIDLFQAFDRGRCERQVIFDVGWNLVTPDAA